MYIEALVSETGYKPDQLIPEQLEELGRWVDDTLERLTIQYETQQLDLIKLRRFNGDCAEDTYTQTWDPTQRTVRIWDGTTTSILTRKQKPFRHLQVSDSARDTDIDVDLVTGNVEVRQHGLLTNDPNATVNPHATNNAHRTAITILRGAGRDQSI